VKIDRIRAADEGKIVRELVERKGLHEFVRQFFNVVEPSTTFIDGWHIGAICEALEAVSRKQIKELVISVPPGCQKSLTASVFWPSWHWSFDPGHKWIHGSYGDDLLQRDAKRMVAILDSQLYGRAWPEFKLRNAKESLPMGRFYNTHGGFRFSCTPGGQVTGWHGHTCVVDDPLKAQDSKSDVAKKDVSDWNAGTLGLRAADPKWFARVLIMQRLASDDLAGELLDQGYEHLCLPMRYVPNAVWDRGCSLGQLDKRETPGALLWPERIDEGAAADRIKALKTSQNVQAQEQQNPTPDTGGIIERGWLRRWSTDEKSEERLPPAARMRWVTSWDLAFDGEKESQSRVAGGLFAACKVNGLPRFFFVTGFAAHMNYPQSKKKIRQLLQGYEDEKTKKRYAPVPLWSNARKHLIEKKANGAAMLAELRNEIRGLKSVSPADSKGDRLVLHSDKFEASEVWFPPAMICSQVAELEDELVFFPNGDYDDFVDIVTQALDELDIPMAGFWANLEKLAAQRHGVK
jgi:phage terminase large subunit-like protein